MSTPVRYAILAHIADYVDERGYPPALQDIADHFGVSRTTVFHHVERLTREGHVTKVPGIPRSMAVTPSGREEVAQWTR